MKEGFSKQTSAQTRSSVQDVCVRRRDMIETLTKGKCDGLFQRGSWNRLYWTESNIQHQPEV